MLIWGLILIAASLLLIILEVFLPSAGLISVAAAALGIAGVVCLFNHDWVWGVIGLLSMLILAPVAFFVALNIMPSTPMGKRLIHGDAEPPDPDNPQPPVNPNQQLAAFIGSTGTALTDLRPVGTIKVDGQRVQARSETSLIPTGSSVRITGVDGAVLKVRKVEG